MVQPYDYPQTPHVRRHGPAGYSTYESYRPWLEDEFSFRCVYCLKRMVWAPTDIWAVDHLVSQSEAPQLACEYDNLVLACQFCNQRKSSHRVPDPCQVAYGACLTVNSDGTVTPHGRHGNRLVSTLRLNHPRMLAERRKWLKIIETLRQHDLAEYESLMGYPPILQDLRKRKAPQNRRPQGLSESCFAKQERDELARIY